MAYYQGPMASQSNHAGNAIAALHSAIAAKEAERRYGLQKEALDLQKEQNGTTLGDWLNTGIGLARVGIAGKELYDKYSTGAQVDLSEVPIVEQQTNQLPVQSRYSTDQGYSAQTGQGDLTQQPNVRMENISGSQPYYQGSMSPQTSSAQDTSSIGLQSSGPPPQYSGQQDVGKYVGLQKSISDIDRDINDPLTIESRSREAIGEGRPNTQRLASVVNRGQQSVTSQEGIDQASGVTGKLAGESSGQNVNLAGDASKIIQDSSKIMESGAISPEMAAGQGIDTASAGGEAGASITESGITQALGALNPAIKAIEIAKSVWDVASEWV